MPTHTAIPTCAAGSGLVAGACKVCEGNSYSLGGKGALCAPCPNTQFAMNDKKACGCAPGFGLSGTVCIGCTGNTASAGGVSATCTTCGAQQVPNTAHTGCVAAPPAPTPPPSTPPTPTPEPTPPPPTPPTTCPVGQGLSGDACAPCPENTISADTSTTCTPCTGDQIANAGRTACEDAPTPPTPPTTDPPASPSPEPLVTNPNDPPPTTGSLLSTPREAIAVEYRWTQTHIAAQACMQLHAALCL